MAAALLLGLATIVTLAAISSAQLAAVTLCPPCNKMMQKVCAKDSDGSVKTFANPCLIGSCNCILNLTKIDRVFTKVYDGDCNQTETEVPQCFPEGSSSASPPVGNVTSTVTETTSAGTPGGRSSNTTTTEAPSGAPVLQTMLLTLALPLAAIPIFL